MKPKSKINIGLIIVAIVAVAVYQFNFSQSAVQRKMAATEDMILFQKCCMSIKDQSILADFVMNNSLWGKRRTALDYITDTVLLEKIIAQADPVKDFDIVSTAQARLEHIKSGRPLSELKPTIQWHNFPAQ